ncbi:hypothetical protein [Rossellomorea sp. RS05]|uniref:hypothetical protein n=1 Tax=Rossellomorea sp. RS05 TaxID=3149166 RepID=UPI00322214BC
MKINRTNDIETVQVSFVKTIVGWFNVYLAGTERYVTLNPADFCKMFPNVSPRTRLGCKEIQRVEAESHFGADIFGDRVIV